MTPPHALRPGAKWTAAQPTDREKHFEIVAVRDETAELRCILNDRRQFVDLDSLADPAQWLRGWR